MPGFSLEKEEKVGVLLEFALVGKVALGGIDIFKVFFDFVLLNKKVRICNVYKCQGTRTSLRAMRFCISSTLRESRKRTSRSRTKFRLDCAEMRDFKSLRRF